jgi:hypothetical protein
MFSPPFITTKIRTCLNERANRYRALAVPCVRDTTKTGFVLEHHPDRPFPGRFRSVRVKSSGNSFPVLLSLSVGLWMSFVRCKLSPVFTGQPKSIFGKLVSDVFYHFPYAAGTDTGAETAADAKLIIHNVFITAIRIILPGDSSVIARCFAHVAIPAYSTGKTTV